MGGSPETITFYTYNLLHKFGFEDGDQMYPLIEEHGLEVDHQDLLVAVVERLVVPRLDQRVETYTIWATLHNPIRARTVDGEEADMDSVITPESIEIPISDILAIGAGMRRSED